MSVGLQRLRDEPDVIREGAIHKGEDPALVDRALELDAARRRLLAETEALKAERNAASKRIGEAIKGGAAPDGPEVADLRAASTAAGDADHGARRRARRRPRPRSTTCSCASRTRPTRTSRSAARRPTSRSAWGEQLPRERAARAARSVPTRRPAARLDPQAALGAGRGARHPRQRARRQDHRLRLPGLQGRRVGAAAGAHQLVPRRPRPRERDDRGLAAGRRQHRQRDGHRPDPRQGRPDVRRHARRPVPGPDGRGPGHEPPSRRDPRGDRAADPLRGLLARASGARPAPPARTPAGSCASTSSTRSRWSCSRSPRTPRLPSNG